MPKRLALIGLLCIALGCREDSVPTRPPGPATTSKAPAPDPDPLTRPGWKRLILPECSVSVEMPGEVTLHQAEAQSRFGPLQVEMHKARNGQIFYNLIRNQMPPDGLEELRGPGIFEARTRKSYLQLKQGKEEYFREIPGAPVPAYEQQFQYVTKQRDASGTAFVGRERLQTYLFDGGTVVLLVDLLATPEQIDNPEFAAEIDFFFDSAKVNLPAAP